MSDIHLIQRLGALQANHRIRNETLLQNYSLSVHRLIGVDKNATGVLYSENAFY